MGKSELVSAIAEDMGIPKAEVVKFFESYIKVVTATLAKGIAIAITGFFALTVKLRAAKIGRHPQTGAEIQIPEANVVSFKVGKTLKDAVNNR
ncbi:MAG: DNA-binding protein HU [Legionellales bacterium]|nr:MAG: DNA-binding protein HU [Legionellales bacterium]